MVNGLNEGFVKLDGFFESVGLNLTNEDGGEGCSIGGVERDAVPSLTVKEAGNTPFFYTLVKCGPRKLALVSHRYPSLIATVARTT